MKYKLFFLNLSKKKQKSKSFRMSPMIGKERFDEILEQMSSPFSAYSWFLIPNGDNLILLVYGTDKEGKIKHRYMTNIL